LLALSVDHLPVSRTPSCREVEREGRKHTIGEATLVGVYHDDALEPERGM
jgi:hypothetical protein